jgi:hypothetical protein
MRILLNYICHVVQNQVAIIKLILFKVLKIAQIEGLQKSLSHQFPMADI